MANLDYNRQGFDVYAILDKSRDCRRSRRAIRLRNPELPVPRLGSRRCKNVGPFMRC